jgi:hypothetical protein
MSLRDADFLTYLRKDEGEKIHEKNLVFLLENMKKYMILNSNEIKYQLECDIYRKISVIEMELEIKKQLIYSEIDFKIQYILNLTLHNSILF